jgi:hypothetical protein
LHPAAVKWVAPACFVLLFVLLFFSWVGIYVGSEMLARQSGWGLAFGLAPTESRANWLKEKILLTERLPSLFTVLTLIYAVLIVAGVVAAIALVVAPFKPVPAIERFLPWRSLVMGGLSILAFLFLITQLLTGFPLEREVRKAADQNYEAAVRKAKEIQETAEREVKLREAADWRQLQEAMLQRRGWLWLVVALNLLAVLASLTDFWLERRVGRPPPRFVFEW